MPFPPGVSDSRLASSGVTADGGRSFGAKGGALSSIAKNSISDDCQRRRTMGCPGSLLYPCRITFTRASSMHRRIAYRVFSCRPSRSAVVSAHDWARLNSASSLSSTSRSCDFSIGISGNLKKLEAVASVTQSPQSRDSSVKVVKGWNHRVDFAGFQHFLNKRHRTKKSHLATPAANILRWDHD